jgi:hypothetical protein
MSNTPSMTSTATFLVVIILFVAIYSKNPNMLNGCNMSKISDTLTSKPTSSSDPTVEKPFEPTEYSTENPANSNQKIDAATLRRVGAEALWSELSDAFQKGSDAPTQAVLENTNWRGLGLTADEIDFYRSVRQLLERQGQDFSGDDWLRRLRQAGYIYGQIEGIFEKTASGAAINPQKINQNSSLQTKLVAEMQQTFDIDAVKTDGFLKKYPQAGCGKWASLVFYLQK